MVFSMHLFLVCGYGIPKDIATDDNYRRYLGIVFNTIYVDTLKDPAQNRTLVFSGGYTDCFPPYKRSEAAEMARLFAQWSERPFCRAVTKHWRVVLERVSLSTIENILYTRDLIQKKKWPVKQVTIFCEATRVGRIRSLTKKIPFGVRVQILPVDFDLSSNRYLDPAFLKKRETMGAKLEVWALKDPKHLKEYQKGLKEKIASLRKAGPGKHAEAVKLWWEKRLKELEAYDLS